MTFKPNINEISEFLGCKNRLDFIHKNPIEGLNLELYENE